MECVNGHLQTDCVSVSDVWNSRLQILFHKHFEILNLNTTLVGDISNKVKAKGKCTSTVAPVHAMNVNGGVELVLPYIRNLGTRLRWVVSFTPPSPLPPGKEFSVALEWEAGWVKEPVWTHWRREKSSISAGNRTTIPRLFSLSPSLYTDWALPASEE
jgi:hypothetical protein